MSRVMSFRDLRLIDEVAQYNEIELLHPDRDPMMKKYLSQLGFDTDYGVLYAANKHRDMQGNVAIGFRAVGEISINRSFINSPLCSTIERIIAAGVTDQSLAQELSRMMGNSVAFISNDADVGSEDDDEFPEDLIELDYEEVTAQIKALEAIRDIIRGSSFDDYGNVKELADE